jgi:biopolymer transport protein ExbD
VLDAELGRLDLDSDLGTGEGRGRVDLSSVELVRWDADAEQPDPLDEDEEAASFTLSRGDPERVEELDLAAMVDVAFQLVLFFLVTATTVLYKSLEVPKPNPEPPAAGATQGKAATLSDLKNDFILVEIDASGAIKIDREPVVPRMSDLVERLRSARETTGRKAMLLSADAITPHRNAVLAYDAANEIGLGIAIARPAQKGDK